MEDGGWIAFDTRDRAFVGAFRVRLGVVAVLGWALLFGSMAGWVATDARAPWVPAPPALQATTTNLRWGASCSTCGLSVCGGCLPATGWLVSSPDAQDGVAWTTTWATPTTWATDGAIQVLRGDSR